MNTQGFLKLICSSRGSPLQVLKQRLLLIHEREKQLPVSWSELLVATYCTVSTFLAIGLFVIDTEVFFWYTREDSVIEYSTAFFLLASFLLCVVRAVRSTTKHQLSFNTLAALAFFFVFGEEISWGQRIFDFATPQELMKINVQKEITVHNLELYGISFKKIFFRLILNSCVLFYFLGFPLLNSSKTWFESLVKKYQIPVPTLRQSMLFLILFFSAFLINEGKKWELVELGISCFAFLAFLFPTNR